MRLPRTRVQNRRGLALVLVIVTIAVLLGFWAMAYRETASLIRVETSRLLNDTRGQQSVDSMFALDAAMTLLEVSLPPNRQVYFRTVTLPDSNIFTVTFTPNNLPGSSNGWTVLVTPGSASLNPALDPANPHW